MLKQFVEFTQSLFPSISPYIQAQTKKSFEQFKSQHKYVSFLNFKPYNFLAQGDIFDNVPFISLSKDGNIGATRQKGILLSNTCSAENEIGRAHV